MTQPPGPDDPSVFGDPSAPQLLATIRDAASADSPLPLLHLASVFASAQASVAESDPEAAGLQELGIDMLEAAPVETEPLVRIWAQMLDDELFRRRVAKLLPTENSKRLPEWLRRAGEIKPFRAAALVSPVRTEETTLLEISTADRSVTLAIAVERSGTPFLEDGYLMGDDLNTVKDLIMQDPEIDFEIVDLSLADGAARIREAAEMGEHMFPPIDTETWPELRPLLDWMLRLAPTGGTGFDLKEWTREEIDELVEDFGRSEFGDALTDEDLEHAYRLFDFQAVYGNNDPLRWSGSFVERIMCDLYPRKLIAPDDHMLRMPTVLEALVQYSNDRSGIDPEYTANSLGAIDDNEEEYIARVQGTFAPEETPNIFVDHHHYEFLAQILINNGVERAGGLENLKNLTGEPLPFEELDTEGVPEDVIDRLTSFAPEIRRIAEADFDEPELATAVLRFLARVARADASIFRRRFADKSLLASLFWIAGRNNSLFEAPGPYGDDRISVSEFQQRMGIGSSPRKNAVMMLEALDYDLRGGNEVNLADPSLLVSSVRRHIIVNRDENWDNLPEGWTPDES